MQVPAKNIKNYQSSINMLKVKKEQFDNEVLELRSNTFDNSCILPLNFYKNSTYNDRGLLILQPRMTTANVEAITLFLKAIIDHPDDLIGDEYLYGYPDTLTTDWSIIKNYLIEKGEPDVIAKVTKATYTSWCEKAHESYLFCLVRRGSDKDSWPEFVLLWEKLIEKAIEELKRITNALSVSTEVPLDKDTRLRREPAKREFADYVTDTSVRFRNSETPEAKPEENKKLEINYSTPSLEDHQDITHYDEHGFLIKEPVFVDDESVLAEFEKITSSLKKYELNIIGPLYLYGYPNLGRFIRKFCEFSGYDERDQFVVRQIQRIHQLYLYYRDKNSHIKKPICVKDWQHLLRVSQLQLPRYNDLFKPVMASEGDRFNRNGILILPPKYMVQRMKDSSRFFVQLLVQFGEYDFLLEKLVYSYRIQKKSKNLLAQYNSFRHKIAEYPVFGTCAKDIIFANRMIQRIHSEYLCLLFTKGDVDNSWPDYLIQWDHIITGKTFNLVDNENNKFPTEQLVFINSPSPTEKNNVGKTVVVEKEDIPGEDLVNIVNDLDASGMHDKMVFFSKFAPQKEVDKTWFKRGNEYDKNGLLILKPLLKRIPSHSPAQYSFFSILKDYPVNLVGFKFVWGYPDIGVKTFGDVVKHLNAINAESVLPPIDVSLLKQLTETIHKVFLYHIYNLSDKAEEWSEPVIIWSEIIHRSYIEANLLKKFLICQTELNGNRYNSENYLILEPEVMDSKYELESLLIFLRSFSEYSINLAKKKYTLSEETVSSSDWLSFQKFSRIQSQSNFFYKQFTAKESEEICDKIHKEFLYYKAIYGENKKNIWPQYLIIWELLLGDSTEGNLITSLKECSPTANGGYTTTQHLTANSIQPANTRSPSKTVEKNSSKSTSRDLKLLKRNRKKMKKREQKLKKSVKGLKKQLRELKMKHRIDILAIEKSVEANNLLFGSKLQSKDKEVEDLKNKVLFLENRH